MGNAKNAGDGRIILHGVLRTFPQLSGSIRLHDSPDVFRKIRNMDMYPSFTQHEALRYFNTIISFRGSKSPLRWTREVRSCLFLMEGERDRRTDSNVCFQVFKD